MRAPYGVGSGVVRITLSYPGLEDWNVVPATIEVSVRKAGWRGWLREFGPWFLGASLVAGAAWLGIRKMARRGRTGAPDPGVADGE